MGKSNWMRILLTDGDPFLEDVGGEWVGDDKSWVWEVFDCDMEPLWEDEGSEVGKALKSTEGTVLEFIVMVYGLSYHAERYDSWDYGVDYDAWMDWEDVELKPVQPYVREDKLR